MCISMSGVGLYSHFLQCRAVEETWQVLYLVIRQLPTNTSTVTRCGFIAWEMMEVMGLIG